MRLRGARPAEARAAALAALARVSLDEETVLRLPRGPRRFGRAEMK